MDAELVKGVRVRNMKAHMNLEKSYQLDCSEKEGFSKKGETAPLSMQVLNQGTVGQSSSEIPESAFRRLMDDLRGSLAPERSLSFDRADIKAGPLNLKIENHEMEFRLVRSLPHGDYFRADLMGGTVMGSFSLSEQEGLFIFKADCSLSGLNIKKLLPNIIQEIPDREAELSGRLSLKLPLSTDPGQLLNDLGMSVDLTQIGARTLERFLYAMDPYESNEGIVQQRNLLRMGTPRWIRLRIRHGSLSLYGEVEAKGIRLDLPPVERINVADLPVRRQMEDALSGLGHIIDMLKKVSADTVCLGPEGEIRFGTFGP